MESEWLTKPLVEFCVKIGSGSTPRGGSSVYIDKGEISLIRSQNVYNDGFKATGLVYITKEAADKLKNVIVEENDVLINITGDSVARVCLPQKLYLPARVNQHVAIIRTNQSELDSKYLRYYLISPFQQSLLLTLASAGATRNALTKGMLEGLEIKKPGLQEQKSIAHILGSLDDKIELSRQMNQTLEQMAQALFKSWFIDFDPVIENAFKAGNPIPDMLKEKAERRQALGDKRKLLPKDIQNLFPDAFEFNEELDRWIPKGWRVGKIKEVAVNIRNAIQPESICVDTPYIGLQDMPQKSISLSQWGSSNDIGSNKYAFSKGDILFGKLRPYFHKVGIAPTNGVCSTDILVVSSKNDDWLSLVLGHLTSDEFIEYVTNSSTGTRMPRTNWKDMSNYSIVIPNQSIAAELNILLSAYLSKIDTNIFQIKELTLLRDTLLPKLISGEVRVK